MILLTSENIDPVFYQTFITTYLSFCSSSLLVNKLIERYNVPESLDSQQILIIRSKISSFLKDWLETNPEDLTVKLLKKIHAFVKEIMVPASIPLSNEIAVITDTKLNRKTTGFTKLNIPLTPKVEKFQIT